MLCKFQFFQDVAEILAKFLKQFQTDSPVLPFLSDILEFILRRVMKMFLLSSYLKEVATPCQVLKLDYKSDCHRLPLQSVKLPTATEALLNQVQ